MQKSNKNFYSGKSNSSKYNSFKLRKKEQKTENLQFTVGAAVERSADEPAADDAAPAAARVRRQQEAGGRAAAAGAVRADTAAGRSGGQDEADRAATPTNGRPASHVPSAVLAWQPAATVAAWQPAIAAPGKHGSAGAD